MISRIEALNYRCLRYIDQNLGPFQLLVGANATGKTTFLDVVGFLADVVTDQARVLQPCAIRIKQSAFSGEVFSVFGVING